MKLGINERPYIPQKEGIVTNYFKTPKSYTDINWWLAAATVGCRPSGKWMSKITRVEPGEKVTTFHSGYCKLEFGSHNSRSVLVGKAPNVLGTGVIDRPFTTDYWVEYTMTAPSVVYTETWNSMRTESEALFFCATDEQIETAKRMINISRRLKSVRADTTPLVNALVENWAHYESWQRTYIRKGTCYDSGGNPDSKYFEGRIEEALQAGPLSDVDFYVRHSLTHEHLQLAYDACLYHGKWEEVRKQAGDIYDAQMRAERRAYAQQQVQRVLEAHPSLTEGDVWRVVRQVGVGWAYDFCDWAYGRLGLHTDSEIPRIKLTRAAMRARKGRAAKYVEDVFKKGEQIAAPPGAFQEMWRMIAATQALGYIPADIDLTIEE